MPSFYLRSKSWASLGARDNQHTLIHKPSCQITCPCDVQIQKIQIQMELRKLKFAKETNNSSNNMICSQLHHAVTIGIKVTVKIFTYMIIPCVLIIPTFQMKSVIFVIFHLIQMQIMWVQWASMSFMVPTTKQKHYSIHLFYLIPFRITYFTIIHRAITSIRLF